jgi:ParB family chromosome partitioning protein
MKRQACPIDDISLAAIRVLNPRPRSRNMFKEITKSIDRVGLKRPITVSTQNDLVCGEGRIEAFKALDQSTIPGLRVEASVEDCILMGLVENLARFRPTSLELLGEVNRLAKTCTGGEIAARLGVSTDYVASIRYLLKHGEERLLDAVAKKRIPHTVAIEIARAKDGKLQHALVKAFEKTKVNTRQMASIRRIAEERQQKGKAIYAGGRRRQENPGYVADELIRTYKVESERKQATIRRAELTRARLLFIVNALRTLLRERMFVRLLREESLDRLPLPLLHRIAGEG